MQIFLNYGIYLVYYLEKFVLFSLSAEFKVLMTHDPLLLFKIITYVIRAVVIVYKAARPRYYYLNEVKTYNIGTRDYCNFR